MATAAPPDEAPHEPTRADRHVKLTFERAETGAKLVCVCRNAPSPGDVVHISYMFVADSQHQFDPDSDLLT